MIRLPAVPVPLDATEGDWPRFIAPLLGVAPREVLACRLVRRSVDARRKDNVRLAVTLDVAVAGDENQILKHCSHPQASIVPVAEITPVAERVPVVLSSLIRRPAHRPVVVGSGPAGLFAALRLAQAGLEPVLVERGRDAKRRKADVEALWQAGTFDPESNVQFGEGGAGTFSDGKLTTGIKDPRCREVLAAFVRCGAPEDILWQAKPHIGTDLLIGVVQNLRAEIEALGGTVLFETQMIGLLVDQGALRGALLSTGETIETEAVVLAIGHSARDTFEMLKQAGVAMQPKPFSIGARIEHPQALIDRAQYGRFAGHSALGAADYKLATRLSNGRGVYTFCMCPGGFVVCAASEAGGVVTNGMSIHARDGKSANSALLVDVTPLDFPGDDPLAGMTFQQKWERLAFELGGGGYRAPAQRMADFLQGFASRIIDQSITTYRPGVTPSNLAGCLPAFAIASMRQAALLFDRQLQGFASPEAVLTGVETRSSCPVRIPRDETGQASLRGLFPAGEGAGYAGGILSAAVDGIRAADNIIEHISQPI